MNSCWHNMDPVLIIGAGPVGLTAAAFLAQAGTPVRIIDANDAPTTLSKALVLWRRSLLTLAPLIPPSYWDTVAEPIRGAYFADNGALVAHLNLLSNTPADPTQAPSSMSTAALSKGDAAAAPAADAQAASQQQYSGRAHALPAGMLVTQADVEAALVALLLDRFGITVQRNTSLASFAVEDDSSSVLCTLISTSGTASGAAIDTANGSASGTAGGTASIAGTAATQQFRASYLIGCDGGKSSVRKLLGLQFAGTTLDQRWLLGDFKYELDESVNAAHRPQHPCEGSLQRGTLFVSPTDVGLVGLIPLGKREGEVRIIWNADSRCPGEPSMEDFQQLLTGHTRQQMHLIEPIWLSEFKINERQVESYLHYNGRVLLAGDAAHIHSPAGGQGMNTGMQDAANLAWKLSLVAAGEAAAGGQLLETYQEERHPVGAQVIRLSGRLLRANAQRNPLFGFLRKWAIRTLLRLPAFTNKMISALAGDGISYSHCSLAASAPAAPAAGHAAAPMLKPLTAVQKQMWGCCKPGAAFPDVSIAVDGVEQSAAVLLQSKPGCFGTLVLLPDAQQEQQQGGAAEGDSNVQKENAAWPNSWGHWPLNVVQVQQQQQQQAGGGAGVVDAWGLLAAAIGGKRACDVGVLVRPDGMVAVVGAPAEVQGWLAKHVAAHTCKLDGRGGVDAAAHACT